MPRLAEPGTLLLAWVLLVPALAGAQDAPVEEEQAEQQAEQPAEPPRDPSERRIAVLILATGGVDAETADALTELAIGSVASRGGVRIVGKEEVQAQLGQGEARSIECVSSAACLGRVGVELDVDEVIAGTVARRRDTWIFNINRIDTRTGELAGRAFREVSGDVGALADAVGSAIPSLYEAPRRPATLLISANVEGAEIMVDQLLVGVYRDEPIRVEDVAPGRHEVTVSAPGHLDWTRTTNVAEGTTLQLEASLQEVVLGTEPYVSPLIYIGAGAAAIGAGAAVYFVLSSRKKWEERDNRADAIEFVEARERDALFGNIAMGVGAAGLVTLGIGLLLSDFDGEAAPVRAGIAPIEGGTMMSVGGTF